MWTWTNNHVPWTPRPGECSCPGHWPEPSAGCRGNNCDKHTQNKSSLSDDKSMKHCIIVNHSNIWWINNIWQLVRETLNHFTRLFTSSFYSVTQIPYSFKFKVSSWHSEILKKSLIFTFNCNLRSLLLYLINILLL